MKTNFVIQRVVMIWNMLSERVVKVDLIMSYTKNLAEYAKEKYARRCGQLCPYKILVWCGVAQRAKELLPERCSSEILQDLSTVSCYYQGSGRRVRKSFNIDAKKAQ